MASLMAMPRLPGLSGSASSSFRPVSVTVEGLGCTVAPNSSIIERR